MTATETRTSKTETVSVASPLRGRKEGNMALTHPTYTVTIRTALRTSGRQVTAWTEPVTLTGLTANQALMLDEDWMTYVVSGEPE
jgi:hypothetical protein